MAGCVVDPLAFGVGKIVMASGAPVHSCYPGSVWCTAAARFKNGPELREKERAVIPGEKSLSCRPLPGDFVTAVTLVECRCNVSLSDSGVRNSSMPNHELSLGHAWESYVTTFD